MQDANLYEVGSERPLVHPSGSSGRAGKDPTDEKAYESSASGSLQLVTTNAPGSRRSSLLPHGQRGYRNDA
jgi:hypothetical protein